jgi:hypothetical protein
MLCAPELKEHAVSLDVATANHSVRPVIVFDWSHVFAEHIIDNSSLIFGLMTGRILLVGGYQIRVSSDKSVGNI